MLHIHNGDSTAETARKANIPGEHLAWREALVCGPARGDLPEPDFLEMRAHHLSTAYPVELDEVRSDQREQYQALESFHDHEEVVLWFEHDLFCQVHLIYLLNWFAQREFGDTKLSLICIGEFPGVPSFAGLGELNENQLASLLPGRAEVAAAQLELGARAWDAYSSSDPFDLVALGDSDTAALPFLHRAIVNHLQRFPWARTGIGRVERTLLQLAADGHNDFKDVFHAFNKREGEYGFGDGQVYLALKRMRDAATPLLQGDAHSTSDPTMLKSSFAITEFGAEVLAGNQDFVVQNGIDLWLGGVHLLGPQAKWRWDNEAQELVPM
jgi:uncharacterized protein DUF1835